MHQGIKSFQFTYRSACKTKYHCKENEGGLARRYRHNYINFLLRTAKKFLLKSQIQSEQWRMSSLQELKVWIHSWQENTRKDQNLLHFLFKKDTKRVEWEQAGKAEGSCWTKDTAPLAQLLWDGQVDTKATQSNRSARGKSNITDQKSEETID